jgi:hypothetical protein
MQFPLGGAFCDFEVMAKLCHLKEPECKIILPDVSYGGFDGT